MVDLPLWKIWVRQLGWWLFPTEWENNKHIPVTTNQLIGPDLESASNKKSAQSLCAPCTSRWPHWKHTDASDMDQPAGTSISVVTPNMVPPSFACWCYPSNYRFVHHKSKCWPSCTAPQPSMGHYISGNDMNKSPSSKAGQVKLSNLKW